jgi:hypothetical protein
MAHIIITSENAKGIQLLTEQPNSNGLPLASGSSFLINKYFGRKVI